MNNICELIKIIERDKRIKNIQVERIYSEVYGDIIKDQEYQRIKKAEIEQIIKVYERVK